MHFRIPYLVLFFTAISFVRCTAQEIIMAKDNFQLTLSAAPVNFHERAMRSDMDKLRAYKASYLKQLNYNISFSKPLSLTAEYAISNYTAIGINLNHFSYNLSEVREDGYGITDMSTKGRHIDLHLRAVRYVYQSVGSSFYVIGEAGLALRSIRYSDNTGSNAQSSAYINTFPETRPNGFQTFSYDYGVGMKIKVFKTLGVSGEFTRLSLLGRYGLFYTIQPPGRRLKDNIGW